MKLMYSSNRQSQPSNSFITILIFMIIIVYSIQESEAFGSICTSNIPVVTFSLSRLDSKKNGNDDYDQDNYIVTDEEALLACRAFLQRKNRVGWTQAKQRKVQAGNSLALSSSSSTTSMPKTSLDDITGSAAGMNLNAGYFWEDPSELVYLKKGRPRRMVMDANVTFFDEDKEAALTAQTSQIEYYDEDDEMDDDLGYLYRYDQGMEDIQLRKAEDANNEGGIFTSFPLFPPTTHVLQSQAKKKRFQDPEWKARWYQRRWGDHSPKRTKREKRIKQLIQKIPSEILRSPELASLSDEEIEEAIRNYVLANKKRSKSHLKRAEEMKRMYQQNSISFQTNQYHLHCKDYVNSTEESLSQLSFVPSDDELKTLQKTRSKRATKAYATRLKNLKNKSDQTSKSHNVKTPAFLRQITVEGELTPRQAMERVEEMIRDGKTPLMDDIDTILEPNRLAGRKKLFQMVLSFFDLQGNCVPDLSKRIDVDPQYFYSNLTKTDIEKVSTKFVTKCTISELGYFIKYLLT